ncbi:MAG: hypothetical protein U9O85_01660 [Euryarchaeota archaeon]|nr:hypothetical protein [Euryarchaeota archaeon]
MDDIGKHKKGIRKTGSGRKKICTKNPKIVEHGGRKEKQKKLIFMTSYHWEWQWWNVLGTKYYPNAKGLLICADGGGSTGSRRRGWIISVLDGNSFVR